MVRNVPTLDRQPENGSESPASFDWPINVAGAIFQCFSYTHIFNKMKSMVYMISRPVPFTASYLKIRICAWLSSSCFGL